MSDLERLAVEAAREAYAERSERDGAKASAAQYRAGARDDTGEIRMATRACRLAMRNLLRELRTIAHEGKDIATCALIDHILAQEKV